MTADRPDILLFGTGNFAARIVFDIAACADRPIALHLAGRNIERLTWLAQAARGRADIFGRDVEIAVHTADFDQVEGIGTLLTTLRPHVVVQAASAQRVGALRSGASAWTDLIRRGGYSVTAVFQAIFSARVARAIRTTGLPTKLVNCCYPDVVNEMLAADGLDVFSGVGNIAILAHILRGSLPRDERAGFRLLAHYRNLRDWRVAPEERGPVPCRIWLDGREVDDVYSAFPLRLSSEPVPDVSAASAAPYLVALASGEDWSGHLSAPLGLPGGYPVTLRGGALQLDLPRGLSRDEAVAFNRKFEASNGAVVDAAGTVRYTGALREAIAEYSPDLAQGFHIRDIEQAYAAMTYLRDKLEGKVAS